MRFTATQTAAKALLALGLILVFNHCTSPNTRHQQTPEDFPAEATVAEPETPAEAAPAPATPEPRLYVHIVRWRGESLSHIAQWYTGAARNWKAIIEVNPGLDPKRILIGDQIFIPEDILKTREPMPRDFLPSSVPEKAPQPPPVEQPPQEAPQSPPVEQPPTESGDTGLYGPIE